MREQSHTNIFFCTPKSVRNVLLLNPKKRRLGGGYFCLFFLRCCTQLEREEEVKISCSGSPPKETCLRSSPSIAHWLVLKGAAFLGRVCGGLKFF
jgi:hypothetical protein